MQNQPTCFFSFSLSKVKVIEGVFRMDQTLESSQLSCRTVIAKCRTQVAHFLRHFYFYFYLIHSSNQAGLQHRKHPPLSCFIPIFLINPIRTYILYILETDDNGKPRTYKTRTVIYLRWFCRRRRQKKKMELQTAAAGSEVRAAGKVETEKVVDPMNREVVGLDLL